MDHTDAKLAFAVARRIALAELERGTATSSIENVRGPLFPPHCCSQLTCLRTA